MAENRSMKTSQVAIGTLRQGGGLNPWWHWKMRNGRILDPHSTQGPGFADGLSLGCRSKRGGQGAFEMELPLSEKKTVDRADLGERWGGNKEFTLSYVNP